MSKKNDAKTILDNTVALSMAFGHNKDSEPSAGEKRIRVREVLWTWTKSKRSQHFGEGYARRNVFYATGDVSFVCSSIDDNPDGTSSELSTAFQLFKFDTAKNCLFITGERGPDRPYLVEVYFEN